MRPKTDQSPVSDCLTDYELDARLIVAAKPMLKALKQIQARARSNKNDDLAECKRQMFHIESLASAAIAAALPTTDPAQEEDQKNAV